MIAATSCDVLGYVIAIGFTLTSRLYGLASRRENRGLEAHAMSPVAAERQVWIGLDGWLPMLQEKYNVKDRERCEATGNLREQGEKVLLAILGNERERGNRKGILKYMRRGSE